MLTMLVDSKARLQYDGIYNIQEKLSRFMKCYKLERYLFLRCSEICRNMNIFKIVDNI